MAASALLCESALIGCTLYLPPAPPRPLMRSMAIWAPIELATEPAAANGPDRAEIRPIRFGGSWARTSPAPRLTPATVAAAFFSSVLRDVVTVIVATRAFRWASAVSRQYLDNVSASQRGTGAGARV